MARSTWSSPSTSRRTPIPRSCVSSLILSPFARIAPRLEHAVDERGRGAEVVALDPERALLGGAARRSCSPASARCRPRARIGDSRAAASAPPVSASASESAPHSACHAPAARSCSCSPPRAARPARAAVRAQARASTAVAGLRLCGIVDDPPPAASRTSPTSVCASRTTSRPIFAAAVARRPRARPPSSATGVRRACHGTSGTASPSSVAHRARHLGRRARRRRQACPRRRRAAPVAPRAAARRGRRAGPRASRRPCSRRSSAPLAGGASAPPSASQRCSSARRAHSAAAPSSSATISSRACRATSIAAVSSTSWLVAPWWTWRACLCADALPQRAHERLGRIADGVARPRATASTSSSVDPARLRDRRRARRDHARPADAIASARSASSIASSHAGRTPRRAAPCGTKRGANVVTASKNTVAASPCRRMSKRAPPPSGRPRRASRAAPARGPRAPRRPHSPLPRPGSTCASPPASGGHARRPPPRGAAPAPGPTACASRRRSGPRPVCHSGQSRHPGARSPHERVNYRVSRAVEDDA